MEIASSLQRLKEELYSMAGELEELNESGQNEPASETNYETWGSEYFLNGPNLSITFEWSQRRQRPEEIASEHEPEERKENTIAVMESSIRTARYFGYSTTIINPYLGVTIRRAPAATLGRGVLGRAFPSYGLIEILDSLTGNDFEEVKAHELMHMAYPQKSEYEIRQLTRLSLPFSPRFH